MDSEGERDIDLKELLDLDLSLYEQTPAIYAHAAFAKEKNKDYEINEHETREKIRHQGKENREEDDEKTMIEFIKQLMLRERDAKYEMVEVLNQQISILKEQLIQKQGIIDSLLESRCDVCVHNHTCHHLNQYSLPTHIGVPHAHLQKQDNILNVKTMLGDQMTRNVARVECHPNDHAPIVPVKNMHPVSDVLTEIKGLMEKQMTPNHLDDKRPQKVYRVKFKLDGHALVSCDNSEQLNNSGRLNNSGLLNNSGDQCRMRFN